MPSPVHPNPTVHMYKIALIAPLCRSALSNGIVVQKIACVRLLILCQTKYKKRDCMRVWDFPLRLFHWALFVSIIGAIISAKTGVLWVHERFGLTILGLIIFRIVMGRPDLKEGRNYVKKRLSARRLS